VKISLNWLKDYIDLSGISVDDICDKLSFAGLEIEEVIDQGKQFENFVVGFVKERKKHPNADKLSLCIVSDGSQDYNVVCGAPNVDGGQKVVFAKVGAIVPTNGMKIEKAKIRGEVSLGMLCSERELGISDNHDGILILDPSQKEGTPIADALGMNDVVLDVAITPNRADALSHIGIARDLSAIYKRPLKYPEIELKESSKKSVDAASVEILDPVNCPRYVGKVIMNVEIKESPEWMKRRLKSIGLRPISNVVDVSNYVLYEVGQPLHTFDLDNVGCKKIIVKCAGEKEKFTTLDSKERTLSSTDLMICDGEKPVAVAGVMGGENSEITNTTKNILIESAYFNPSSVRKTAKKLGLQTDASYRFERGCDPLNTIWAARRAAQLIQLTAGGDVYSGEIDAYPNVIERKNTFVRFERIQKILGYTVEKSEVKKILVSLGFEIAKETESELSLSIPTFRHDIEREIDIIEEIARVYGYEKIPDVSKISITLDRKVDQSAYNNNIRETLTSLGFFEIMTNSLLKEEVAERYGKAIKLMNPQNSEMSHLRTSLIPGMLQAVSNNLKVNERDLAFFEIGKVFGLNNESGIKNFDDFSESEHLILGLSGNAIRTEWYEKDRDFDFYDLKGYIEAFLNKLLPEINFQMQYQNADSTKDFVYDISYQNQSVGNGGRVQKQLCSVFDINQEVFVLIFDLGKIKQIQISQRRFYDLLKFPKVYRDFAFVFDKKVESDSVVGIIKSVSSKLLHQIKLFDIFQSDSLGKGKKSLAFQLEYFDETRTLTEEEVEKEFRKAIKAVEEKFNAQLRGC
jgi:phenylalanyl-tRNA synthetase beta chain